MTAARGQVVARQGSWRGGEAGDGAEAGGAWESFCAKAGWLQKVMKSSPLKAIKNHLGEQRRVLDEDDKVDPLAKREFFC